MRLAYEGSAGGGSRAQTVANLRKWFEDSPERFMQEKRRLEGEYKEKLAAAARRLAERTGVKAADEELLAEEPVEGLIEELLGKLREGNHVGTTGNKQEGVKVDAAAGPGKVGAGGGVGGREAGQVHEASVPTAVSGEAAGDGGNRPTPARPGRPDLRGAAIEVQ